MYLSGSSEVSSADDSNTPDLAAVSTCLVCFFILNLNYYVVESLNTALCIEQLGWDEETAITRLGIIMSCVAATAIACSATIVPLGRWLGERWSYLGLGLLPLLLSRIVSLPIPGQGLPRWKNETSSVFRGASPNETDSRDCTASSIGEPGCSLEWCLHTPAVTTAQLVSGIFLLAVGYSYGLSLCHSIFSKVVGPRPQGVWMGLLTSSMSLSGIIGPVCLSYIYTQLGTYWLFGLSAATVAIAILVTVGTWKRLVPPSSTPSTPYYYCNKALEPEEVPNESKTLQKNP